MSLLARDLARRLFGAVGLVSAALVVLFALFDLIEQLDAAGAAGGPVWRALAITALLIPGHLYELFPVATLIGALVVMAQLAASSEYTVMRTSGVSVPGVLRLLLVPTLLLALFGFFAGEWLAPQADRYARNMRLGGDTVVAQQLRSGFWLKDGRNFVNLGGVLPDGELISPVIHEFSADGALRAILRAKSARFDGERHWRLEVVETTQFNERGVSLERVQSLRWATQLGPDILKVLSVEPNRMSVLELWSYLHHLRNNHQDTGRYETALWSKLFYPLSIMVMLLLALSFARLQVRAGGVMPKVFAGILLGIVFHFMTRVGNNLGQLNAWPPLVGAGASTLVFVLAALLLLWRVERI